jgi:hypothetical protein
MARPFIIGPARLRPVEKGRDARRTGRRWEAGQDRGARVVTGVAQWLADMTARRSASLPFSTLHVRPLSGTGTPPTTYTETLQGLAEVRAMNRRRRSGHQTRRRRGCGSAYWGAAGGECAGECDLAGATARRSEGVLVGTRDGRVVMLCIRPIASGMAGPTACRCVRGQYNQSSHSATVSQGLP